VANPDASVRIITSPLSPHLVQEDGRAGAILRRQLRVEVGRHGCGASVRVQQVGGHGRGLGEDEVVVADAEDGHLRAGVGARVHEAVAVQLIGRGDAASGRAVSPSAASA